jgi:hypothetical protein
MFTLDQNMEAINESTPTTKVLQEKLAPASSVDQKQEQNVELLTKVAELKNSAHVHIEKAVALIKILNPLEAEKQEKIENIKPEEMNSQFDAIFLAKDTIPPSEFLSMSQQVMQISKEYLRLQRAELSTLKEKAKQGETEIGWLDDDLEMYKEFKGIKKLLITGLRLPNKTLAKKSNLNKNLEPLNSEISKKLDVVNIIDDRRGMVSLAKNIASN